MAQLEEVLRARPERDEGMEARLDDLEAAVRARSTGGELPSEDVAYLRDKMQNVDQEVADLKRLLLKVQSFAMETNLALMRLAKDTRAGMSMHTASDGGDSVAGLSDVPRTQPVQPGAEAESDSDEEEEDDG